MSYYNKNGFPIFKNWQKGFYFLLFFAEKELLTMVRAVSEDQIYDTIEFNEFLQMMSKQQKDGMNEDSLKDAFR